MKRILQIFSLVIVSFALVGIPALMAIPTNAGELTYPINLISAEGIGASLGTITIKNSDYGLILTPELQGLTPGAHGFHTHTNASCEAAEKDGTLVPGLAAGGHFDPQETGVHAGPYGDGHLGAMPPLFVDNEGVANIPVLAPRLSVSDVLGHAVIVHAKGDNFSDDPLPLGGGGPRVACGIFDFP